MYLSLRTRQAADHRHLPSALACPYDQEDQLAAVDTLAGRANTPTRRLTIEATYDLMGGRAARAGPWAVTRFGVRHIGRDLTRFLSFLS